MKKIGHVFTIILSYLVGLALLVILVYGSVPKADPDFQSAKEAFKMAKEQLEEKHEGCRFFVWQVKAGSVDVFDTSTIKFAKSDKWRITFIKYKPNGKLKMEMVTATLIRGRLGGEGIFDVDESEGERTLIPSLQANNNKLAKWELDSTTIYYKNLFLAKERKYRKLKALEIDLSKKTPSVKLSFVRKMTSIERSAFSLENHFVLELSLSFNGKLKAIQEYPVDL